MLALVTTSSAALTGCKTAESARLRPDAERDAQITTAIQAKLASLASEDAVKSLEIAVTTHDGVVTLKGRVSKDDARQKAERYARETDGVQRVIDLVKVGDRQ
ncbi:MAG TPA: BON domain-containing protein [Thermoanaerobaculia bacterium]|nr:BON domain-containing protein [Thermoanaerobaculia bacterium]